MAYAFLILVAATLASILMMMASMFGGRGVRSVQAAGCAIVAAGAALFCLQGTAAVPLLWRKGIGWIIALPHETVTTMYVIGGTLIVFSLLGALMTPVRKYQEYRSNQLVLGDYRHKVSYGMLRRQVHAFGERFMSSRFTKQSDNLNDHFYR